MTVEAPSNAQQIGIGIAVIVELSSAFSIGAPAIEVLSGAICGIAMSG